VKQRLHGVRDVLMHAYYIDDIYHRVFEAPAYALAGAFANAFEPWVIAGIPRALGAAVTALGGLSRAWESGYLRRYGLTIAVGAAFLLYFVVITLHASAQGIR
jgi:NADH:ubiquinone oxidoreductase subunit 5 (subunit L)/multisubunit Na+/H+ antiporter MnhA subunit